MQTGMAKNMMKAHLKLVAPTIENRTVTPTRLPNAALRTREHLTEAEVERLMNAARKNRWGHRDATMVLMAYRHGFRPAELVDLRWDQIEFTSAALHVRRVKRGTPSTHPILGDELRALRRLQRGQEPKSPFVFTSERGAPFTTAGSPSWNVTMLSGNPINNKGQGFPTPRRTRSSSLRQWVVASPNLSDTNLSTKAS